MGVNRVIADGEIVLDLTHDTVTTDSLAKGFTAHNAAGDPIVGVGEGILMINDDAGKGDTDVAWSANQICLMMQNAFGLTPIVGFKKDFYINVTGSVGTVINIETEVGSNTGLSYKIIDCVPNEKFTINGKGGTSASARRWTFINSNNAILDSATTNGESVNEVITAPENAVKLILINNYLNYGDCISFRGAISNS